MSIQVVILAAGQGKRMYSSRPKVLQPLAGKPLLLHVVETALPFASHPIVVCGHQAKVLQTALSHCPLHWVEQKEQLGTGHALLQALPQITEERILILYGDVPLISVETLKQLIESTPSSAVGLLTAMLSQPTGYGRILRDNKDRILGVVEEKEATPEQRAIQEINTGIYIVPTTYLKKWLPTLKNNNAQREYYLTDIISLAVQEGIPIHSRQPAMKEEILGVNDCVQLAELERFYQRQAAEKLMRQGVILADPARIDIRGEVEIGRDVRIDVNVIFEGKVVIGEGCIIGPQVVLRDAQLGARVEVKANSVIEGAHIADDGVIGPFARLRPGTVLEAAVHIGNFVEIKQSVVGAESKINHLSYIGDSEVGKQVNIGAGTITCNYDGANKYKTIIGDHVFIGSGTELVAPLTIGKGATIGAGSTITKEVPPEKLTLARAAQLTVEGWQRPEK